MPDLVPTREAGAVGLNCQKYLTPVVRPEIIAALLPPTGVEATLLNSAVLLLPYQKSPAVGAMNMCQISTVNWSAPGVVTPPLKMPSLKPALSWLMPSLQSWLNQVVAA
ncbi:hypothetical protein ES703_104730 [subsurface metagenome]